MPVSVVLAALCTTASVAGASEGDGEEEKLSAYSVAVGVGSSRSLDS